MTTKSFILLSRIAASIAAILAVMAGVNGLVIIRHVAPQTLMVETWRVVGFFTFGILFLILAYRPRHNTLLWLAVIINKVVLAMTGVIYGNDVQGAVTSTIWDVTLSAILIFGFICSRQGADKT